MNAHTLETPGQKQDKENDHDNDGRASNPTRASKAKWARLR